MRALLIVIAVCISGARLAQATCWHDPSRPGWSCCQAPGGTPSCFERRTRTERLPTPRPRVDLGEWDAARDGRFNPEIAVGPLLLGGSEKRLALGADVRARVLYRYRPPRGVLVIPWLLAAMLIGNEIGLELRGGGFGVHADGAWHGAGYAVGRVGAFLSYERWRIGTAASWFELGVSKVGAEPARLHWGVRVPAAVMLTRHVGLEAEFVALMPERLFGASISAVLRR